VKLSIDHDQKVITTKKYQRIFKVSYGTARSDLNELVEDGLFEKKKLGKGYVYSTNFKPFLISTKE